MTNSCEIRRELARIEQALVDEIKRAGIKKTVQVTGLKQPDISAWIHGKRKWSYEKILNMSEKFAI